MTGIWKWFFHSLQYRRFAFRELWGFKLKFRSYYRPTGSYCSVNTQHTCSARPAIGLRRILPGPEFQDDSLGIYQGMWWNVGSRAWNGECAVLEGRGFCAPFALC